MMEKQIIFKDSVMIDENKFFNLGNLNDKIAYTLKNGKFEKKDFAGCARTASVPLTQKSRGRRLLLQIQKVRACQIVVLQEPFILVLKPCQK